MRSIKPSIANIKCNSSPSLHQFRIYIKFIGFTEFEIQKAIHDFENFDETEESDAIS